MRSRVVVFGVFDGLHAGHIAFLTKAKSLGDELVVVVTRDARVLQEKGKAPVYREKHRASVLRALRMVDSVMLGDPPNIHRILKKLKPSIVALGHDQKIPASWQDVPWTYRVIQSLHRSHLSSSRARTR